MLTGANQRILYNTLTMVNDTKNIEILPEDRVKLTNDQQNLIELALAKQVPPEDADFLEKAQKDSKNDTDSFIIIHNYFVNKYGEEFGRIYLAATTYGEKGYSDTILSIETENARKRVKRQTQN